MTNKELIETYPQLRPSNRWSGKFIEDPDYDYTELDEMPDGWYHAFGEQMCGELNQVIKTWSEEDQKNFVLFKLKKNMEVCDFIPAIVITRFVM